jgi:hypothetical protein
LSEDEKKKKLKMINWKIGKFNKIKQLLRDLKQRKKELGIRRHTILEMKEKEKELIEIRKKKEEEELERQIHLVENFTNLGTEDENEYFNSNVGYVEVIDVRQILY